ncbi:protein kinase domain-containing protein [Streptomyces sp. P17]|uniref:protein kinase domain-containing protein n=1 Tax=Streptomyces sp. P17 TaxID=3074716 RepID=UPI0028F41E06|nr:PQQ-binding-like beta-propeller repeat protein [Streptomyces sp. P17]MDT9701005.1 PQQ-binding-like beta-propeller repeat protein [Streptomyces sp. P17]
MPLHKDDPKSVGGYRLADRLGAGGMGVVYRGRSRSGREVAVKVVHAQYAEDPVFRARFRQEIEAVRKVSGAFTAPVLDADAEAARPWMATQYVPGRSLAAHIRELGPLRDPELRRLALGLVEALREIHRAGVVHRDLKPANVLLADDGPRVIDFGISRAAENITLTETGQMVGTPPFMSPEQLTDARSVGPSSDVFSLGALLVYTVTGRGPFDADSPYLTAYRVVHDEPVMEGVSEALRGVLERCLAKEAADRPELDELAGEFAMVLPEEAADRPELDELAGEFATVLPEEATDRPELDELAGEFAMVLPEEAAERPELDELAGEFAMVLPEEAADDPPTVTLLRDTPPLPDTGGADPAPDTSPGRRRRLRPLWAATATVGTLALGLTAYLLNGPGWADSEGEGGATRTQTAASRWTQELPTGWQPWQTTVYATADRGVKKGRDLLAEGVDSGPECQMYEDSLYCAGDGVLPLRLDGLTGRTDWRADVEQPATGKASYVYELLGVVDDAMLVEHRPQMGQESTGSVTAFDTETGKRLWQRTVDTRWSSPHLSGDLVILPDDSGDALTARSPRTGTERWTAPLPKAHYCYAADSVEDLYLECAPDITKPAEDMLLLGLDRSDGSTRRLTVPNRGVLFGMYDGRLLYLDPAVNEDGDVLAGDEGPFSRIRLVHPETGVATTTKLAENFEGKVTLADGKLWFTGSSGQVTAVSARTGKQLWQTPTSLEQPSAVTHDPRTRVVYLSSGSGRVAALDAEKGTLLWETLPRAKWVNKPSRLPEVLLHKGALVVPTPAGDIFTLDPAHPDRKPVSG